jgi:Bacterial toxin 44
VPTWREEFFEVPIWDNGAGMTGIDTWNRNTYYQYRDTALLSSNASLGESNRGNTPMFFNQVKPGGPWDYKRNAENRGFYFFNGQLVSAEEFGNLNYGYSGTAFGIGKDTLTDAAGAVQIVTSGRDNRGPTLRNFAGNFDDPRDTRNIRIGVNTYNNSNRPNTSASYAGISNAAYNASVANLVRQISALVATISALVAKLK